jgi:hypothetical protein
MQEGNKTVFAVSTRQLRIIKAAFKQSLGKNPVYAGYTVETHNYLSANRSVMLSTQKSERRALH